jgi:hypothetical protein
MFEEVYMLQGFVAFSQCREHMDRRPKIVAAKSGRPASFKGALRGDFWADYNRNFTRSFN